MNLCKCLLIAALAACPLVSAEQASAQYGGGFGGCGYGGYGGLGAYVGVGSLYGIMREEHVPYYSMFPPVYYSRPVPRTYGYSPLAYLPTTMTPDYAASAPLTINNPYVKGEPASIATEETGNEQPKPNLDQTTQAKRSVAPLAVSNPFFTPRSQQLEGPILRAASLR